MGNPARKTNDIDITCLGVDEFTIAQLQLNGYIYHKAAKAAFLGKDIISALTSFQFNNQKENREEEKKVCKSSEGK